MSDKEELLKTIAECDASASVKDLAKTCVESAYSAGFQEGMKRGSEIISKTFEMMYSKKRGK